MPSNNVSCLLRYIIIYWGHDSKSILCKSPNLWQESEPVAQRKHNTSNHVNVSAWWLPRTKRKKELQMQIRNLSLTILVLYIELDKYSTSLQNQQTTYLTFIKIQLFTMIHPTHESQPFCDAPRKSISLPFKVTVFKPRFAKRRKASLCRRQAGSHLGKIIWNNKTTFKGNMRVTVDGRNPAPVDMVDLPLFTRFHTSQVVVWDFWTMET